MNLSAPLSVVTSSLDGPVLTALARTNRPASGRDVHRLCGVGSPAGVHKVLRRLVLQGIVDGDRRAGVTLYSLNRQHLAASAIESLARIAERLIEEVRETLRSWDQRPEHASLYGSFARGVSDEHSDIDLFVVRAGRTGARWGERVTELEGRVRALTGNDLAVLEWSISELRANRGTPLVATIEAEHIHLIGRPLRALLRGSR